MGIELNNDQLFTIMDLENWWHSASSKQVFEISGAAGTGKAQPDDTIIPTPKGEKYLKDLEVGDYVFNRKGKPVKILDIFPQGKLKAFKVCFSDGRSTICNDEHLWTVKIKGKKKMETLTLRQIMEQGLYTDDKKTTFKFSIPQAEPVEYKKKFFNVDPFEAGIGHRKILNDRYAGNMYKRYLYGDREQRLAFLRGLISDNGYHLPKSFTGYNIIMMKELQRMINGLGVSCGLSMTSLGMYTMTLGQNTDLRIVNIEELNEEVEMRCIYVDDEEHLYLTNDFIVTHNTTMIRYFIERIGLKYENVLFLAFMGKAASQMARNGLPAKTIHSAIYDCKEMIVRDENGEIVLKKNGKPKMKKYFVLKDHIDKKIELIVIDEGSMVDTKTALDILSFGIPVIVLGDLNQLPPVFGNPFFLVKPDAILHQIMRQKEGDPIIWLSQQVLEDKELKYGVYKNSAVIRKSDLTEFNFRSADIILTGTNRLRYNINNYCRQEIKKIKNLEYPHLCEKVICRKNNWGKTVGDNIYLTNGTTGFVDYIDKKSFNGKTMSMDFRPDFTKKVFKGVVFDYNHMYSIPNQDDTEETHYNYYYDKMEYAYAITTHNAQGGGWQNVLYLHEDFMRNPVDRKKLMYTAITRASESITIVI